MQKKNLFFEQISHLQIVIAWVIYFFINVVFCIKYNPVEVLKPVYFIVCYPLIVFGIYRVTVSLKIQQKNHFFLFLSGFVVLLAVFLLFYIDKWSVQVDRWSALSFWSENLNNGKFPYGTPSHLGGYASPFPIWQLFHFPFHLLGDTGYGQIFCLLVFFVFLFRCRTRINIGGFVLLMALSPAFWWEMAVRSDLLCNMLLLFVFLASQFYDSTYWKKRKYLAALITGLFLCTKLMVAIPLFLFFFPQFLKYTLKEKILFALIVIAGFVIPFVPFAIGEYSILNHPEYNPLLLQSRQGTIWVVVVLAILMIFSSLSWEKMKTCFFWSGVFLFLLVFSVGFRIFLANDLNFVLFEDEFDKSYFNVCLPFFLFCIHEIKKIEFNYSKYTFNI
jgi:hypothetical protein